MAEDEIVSITNSMDINLNKLQEIVKDRGAWCVVVQGTQRVRHDVATEQQLQFLPYKGGLANVLNRFLSWPELALFRLLCCW